MLNWDKKNLNSVGDSGIFDAVGDMNLMADSILGESDWLNDQSLGLENTIWECLSDKGKLITNVSGRV